MDKQKTGQVIKDARIKKGYTQAELGDILGVTNKAVSRWEKGASFPDVGVIENLANALDINIEEIKMLYQLKTHLHQKPRKREHSLRKRKTTTKSSVRHDCPHPRRKKSRKL